MSTTYQCFAKINNGRSAVNFGSVFCYAGGKASGVDIGIDRSAYTGAYNNVLDNRLIPPSGDDCVTTESVTVYTGMDTESFKTLLNAYEAAYGLEINQGVPSDLTLESLYVNSGGDLVYWDGADEQVVLQEV
jgi:hypothetical protein